VRQGEQAEEGAEEGGRMGEAFAVEAEEDWDSSEWRSEEQGQLRTKKMKRVRRSVGTCS